MINTIRRWLGLCVHVWGPWHTNTKAFPLVPDIDPASGEVTDRGYTSITTAARQCTSCGWVKRTVLR